MIQVTIRNITGADVAALKVLSTALSGYWTVEVANDEVALKVTVKSELCDEFATFSWFEGEPDDDLPSGWELEETSMDIPETYEKFDMTEVAQTLESLVQKVVEWYVHSEREV